MDVLVKGNLTVSNIPDGQALVSGQRERGIRLWGVEQQGPEGWGRPLHQPCLSPHRGSLLPVHGHALPWLCTLEEGQVSG